MDMSGGLAWLSVLPAIVQRGEESREEVQAELSAPLYMVNSALLPPLSQELTEDQVQIRMYRREKSLEGGGGEHNPHFFGCLLLCTPGTVQ